MSIQKRKEHIQKNQKIQENQDNSNVSNSLKNNMQPFKVETNSKGSETKKINNVDNYSNSSNSSMNKTSEIYLKSFIHQECQNILSEYMLDAVEKMNGAGLIYREEREKFLKNRTTEGRKKETDLLIEYRKKEEEKLKIERYRNYYLYHYKEFLPDIYKFLLRKNVVLKKDEICISTANELTSTVRTILFSLLDENDKLQDLINDKEKEFQNVYNNVSMIEKDGSFTDLSFEDAEEKKIVYREYYLHTSDEQLKTYPPSTIKAVFIINDYDDVKKFLEQDAVMKEFMTEGHYTTIIKRLKQRKSVLYGYYDVFDIDPNNIYKLKDDLRTYDNKLKCYFLFNNIQGKIDVDFDDEFDEEIVSEETNDKFNVSNENNESVENIEHSDASNELENGNNSNGSNSQNTGNKDIKDFKFDLNITSKENDKLVETILEKSDSYNNQLLDIEYMKIKGENPEKENNVHYMNIDNNSNIEYSSTTETIESDNVQSNENIENNEEIENIEDIENSENSADDYETQEDYESYDEYDEYEDYGEYNEYQENDEQMFNGYENINDVDDYENNYDDYEDNYEDDLVSDFSNDIENEQFGQENKVQSENEVDSNENIKNAEINEKPSIIQPIETKIVRRKEVIYVEKQILCKITPSLYCVTSEIDPNIIIGIQAKDFHEYQNGGWIEIRDNYYSLFKVMKRQKVSYSGINKKATVEVLRKNFEVIKIEETR